MLAPPSVSLLWAPERDAVEPTLESLSEALLKLGARQWQVDIAGPIIMDAINRPDPPTAEPEIKPAVGVSE